MKRTFIALLMILSAPMLSPFACAAQTLGQMPEHVTRSLSGTVTDSHGEPLKGAVVEVQNESDKSVISFLSNPDGHYEFKRINSSGDFSFWATYRGHRSKTHTLGKFNSHLTDVVNLEINLD